MNIYRLKNTLALYFLASLPCFAAPAATLPPPNLNELKSIPIDAQLPEVVKRQQQTLRERAAQAGRDIELSVSLDTDVIYIPRNIAEQVTILRTWQKDHGRWRAAYQQIELAERQRAKANNEKTYEKFWCSAVPGDIVSFEEAVQQIGPPPVLAIRSPSQLQSPGTVLEFKNVSDKTHQINLNWRNGFGGMGAVGVTNLDKGWKSGKSYGAPENMIELAPGETYTLRVSSPEDSFGFFATEPSEFQMDVSLISGLQYSYEYSERMLTEEALIINAKPVRFRVEFEK